EPRGASYYVNPYSGELLGMAAGEPFFNSVRELHRWLLSGAIGKQIVAAATMALLALSLSGLYLRWPRRLGNWRVWLTFNPRKRGRSLFWDLHSVIGTWVLPFYLLASLTGLYWSYEWYRNGLYALSGVEQPVRARNPAPINPSNLNVNALWAAFEAAVPAYSEASLRLSVRPDHLLEFIYQSSDPPHARANNHLLLDPASGQVRVHERYAAKPLNEKLMSSMLALHSGEFFGRGGLLAMMLASLGMPLFAITGWTLYLDRRAKKRAKRVAKQTVVGGMSAADRPGVLSSAAVHWLIGFASQSGVAERLAWQTAGVLQGTGATVMIRPLGELESASLAGIRHALFVVSTFGDGEPPDNARRFARRVMGHTPPLHGLRFGLLALGDREYRSFCGFGRRLSVWLRGGGAEPLFDTVEMNGRDEQALRLWQCRIAVLAGTHSTTRGNPWTEPGFQLWRLGFRRELNPGSQGLPTFHIELLPDNSANANWRAGDIAEVLIPSGPGTEASVVREYSIASLPASGAIELLVRQARTADGRLGRGAAWLTQCARTGACIELRIRHNSAFHAPSGESRPAILIGNGTGLAGLRAHLAARITAGHRRNWLVFGERNAACDFYFEDEIRRWLAMGAIERLDLAFSRDGAARIYVQDRLRMAAQELRNWVEAGAAIYVCGSAVGMAPGVDAA
ncbi:MAG TPA: sulfite reductase flavoprotein subunit alpha, partial [Nitrococcus sp.]|nr:sulfite reductase flavoprotein subunit alpha [Nitrococcus sp.]